MTPAIHTYSGTDVPVMAPAAVHIHLEDIAHALAMLCRFGGHTREFYSVAQHSVFVSHLVPAADALHGLLHDASEAYLSDIIRPVKHLKAMAPYRAVEAQLQAVIYGRFGLAATMPESVHDMDNALLVTEASELLPVRPAWVDGLPSVTLKGPIVCWPPAVAKQRFLARFAALSGGAA